MPYPSTTPTPTLSHRSARAALPLRPVRRRGAAVGGGRAAPRRGLRPARRGGRAGCECDRPHGGAVDGSRQRVESRLHRVRRRARAA
eukprot:3095934-Prymnesium_polylepis.1